MKFKLSLQKIKKFKGSLLGCGIALLAMGLLTRCGKESGPASGTFSHVYQTTLKTACIECHVPTGAATVSNGVLLDFTTQALAYSTLTSKYSTGNSTATCSAAKIVVAGTVASSYLAGVLFTEYNVTPFPGAGSCAPYNVHLSDQHLSADEKTSITTWIANGAKND